MEEQAQARLKNSTLGFEQRLKAYDNWMGAVLEQKDAKIDLLEAQLKHRDAEFEQLVVSGDEVEALAHALVQSEQKLANARVAAAEARACRA